MRQRRLFLPSALTFVLIFAGCSDNGETIAMGGAGGADETTGTPGAGGTHREAGTSSDGGAGGSTGAGGPGGSGGAAGGGGASGGAGSATSDASLGGAGGNGPDAGGGGATHDSGSAGTAPEGGTDTGPTSECRAPGTLNVTSFGDTAYVIDDLSNPALTLCRGATYTFLLVSVAGHPFSIRTEADDDYFSGVTGNGRTTGQVIFAVPMNAPDQLKYSCSVHPVMTGPITIVN